MKFNEFIDLGLENPASNLNKPFNELAYSDLKLESAKAIYPLIRAISTAKLTRNYTYYPMESMTEVGSEVESPKGYLSFLYPYARPVITEHRLQDSKNGIKGDEPIGRIVASYWKGHTSEKATDGKPGFVEGDGALYLVPAITSPAGIEKITTGIYQTVSIGTKVSSAIESITGTDIAKPKEGDEMPTWPVGSMIEGKEGEKKLSYLELSGLEGREISFVNAPSDTHAQIQKRDLGKNGIRLLTGHKTKEGVKFYDISDRSEVFVENFVDTDNFQDSYERAENCAIVEPKNVSTPSETTSIKIGEFVEYTGMFGSVEGKIVNIFTDGLVEFAGINLQASPSNPVARVRVYKDSKPTNVFIHKNLAVLLQKDKN
jgi:hypothetical protein